ncbi:hypothetical protein PG997_001642 [Apiospora hydei]|uniref:Uncharacterized protein n=1 Tax=Apiospora hydei TaxID=1337664 RepID=A0ABR1XEB2_9PEZI
MPRLSDISYSREATIAAVRDYYQFLRELGYLGKTDEVIELLRHLPYIRNDGDVETPQAAPGTHFVDWARLATRNWDRESMLLATDGGEWEHVPPHVVGLALEARWSFSFNLDTELGVIYWIKCPHAIECDTRVEPVLDDAMDYTPEEELGRRRDGPAWAVPDFFELLKGEFRQLNFVPVGPRRVDDDYSNHSGETGDGSTDVMRKLYRDHGWPDLDRYRKGECLEALRNTLREKYPDLLEDDVDYDDE